MPNIPGLKNLQANRSNPEENLAKFRFAKFENDNSSGEIEMQDPEQEGDQKLGGGGADVMTFRQLEEAEKRTNQELPERRNSFRNPVFGNEEAGVAMAVVDLHSGVSDMKEASSNTFTETANPLFNVDIQVTPPVGVDTINPTFDPEAPREEIQEKEPEKKNKPSPSLPKASTSGKPSNSWDNPLYGMDVDMTMASELRTVGEEGHQGKNDEDTITGDTELKEGKSEKNDALVTI